MGNSDLTKLSGPQVQKCLHWPTLAEQHTGLQELVKHWSAEGECSFFATKKDTTKLHLKWSFFPRFTAAARGTIVEFHDGGRGYW